MLHNPGYVGGLVRESHTPAATICFLLRPTAVTSVGHDHIGCHSGGSRDPRLANYRPGLRLKLFEGEGPGTPGIRPFDPALRLIGRKPFDGLNP